LGPGILSLFLEKSILSPKPKEIALKREGMNLSNLGV
jgi:hypothetical protein